MATRTEIVNLALARIGQAPVSSLDEESSVAAAASLVYDTCRRAVLQAYPWSFATRTSRLLRRNTIPVGYAYAFALPPDCLQPVRLQGGSRSGRDTGGQGLSFTVRGRDLLADTPEAVLEYIADVEDAGQYDARFTEALVVRLAAELAMPVGGKSDLMTAYRNEYEAIVRQASAKSSGQFYEDLPENPYLEARL
jgi:hypothetical protein